MKKQLTNTTIYQPNPEVKVKVTNKPLVDRDTGEQFGYETKVAITYNSGLKDKALSFGTIDEIAEFVGNIDFDEPQQSLPLGNVTVTRK